MARWPSLAALAESMKKSGDLPSPASTVTSSAKKKSKPKGKAEK